MKLNCDALMPKASVSKNVKTAYCDKCHHFPS